MYTWPGIQKINKSEAFFRFDHDEEVYLLYDDNTESLVNDREEIQKHDGEFGYEKETGGRMKIFTSKNNQNGPYNEISMEDARQMGLDFKHISGLLLSGNIGSHCHPDKDEVTYFIVVNDAPREVGTITRPLTQAEKIGHMVEAEERMKNRMEGNNFPGKGPLRRR